MRSAPRHQRRRRSSLSNVGSDERKIPVKRPRRQEIQDAVEGAANAGMERLARGEGEPLDDWPDGPPEGDSEAMEHYLAAFRDWHEKHVGPVTDADFQRVRADHGLTRPRRRARETLRPASSGGSRLARNPKPGC